jgi:hypothetical protein
VDLIQKLELRPELHREELQPEDFMDPRDMRHDLASVVGALHTLLETKQRSLPEPVPELLALCLGKLHRTLDGLDLWLRELERKK